MEQERRGAEADLSMSSLVTPLLGFNTVEEAQPATQVAQHQRHLGNGIGGDSGK